MRSVLAAGLILALVGCGPAPKENARALLDPALFEGPRAFLEVEQLVRLGPRDAGTPGAERAARHLMQRLKDRGVADAHIDTFTNVTPIGETVFHNVVGSIPGKGKGIIILGSHFDTKSGIDAGFQGANDSGSSSGALLELARVIASGPELDASVQFVFFDGEECFVAYGPTDGLRGSTHHATKLVKEGRAKDVKAMILLDMIGDRNLTVTLPRNSTPWLLAAVLKGAHAENVRQKFSLHPFQVGDDHVPFLEAGMPAVDIIDFDFGSSPGRNDYWHTAGDTLDKISAESLQTIGRVTIRVVNDVLSRDADAR